MKLYFRSTLASIAVMSTLSANEFVSNDEIKQMEAFEKRSIERQKQQEIYDYMENSEYEVTELYTIAKQDVDWVKDVMKNFDHYVDLDVIVAYEKKIVKMKAHKRSAYLVDKITQLEELVNKKKTELKSIRRGKK